MVRMLQKVDGSHESFAFVDIASENEAVVGFEAFYLSLHIYIYIRHVVIEFADENDASFHSVAELQKRVAQIMVKRRRHVISSALGGAGK